MFVGVNNVRFCLEYDRTLGLFEKFEQYYDDLLYEQFSRGSPFDYKKKLRV